MDNERYVQDLRDKIERMRQSEEHNILVRQSLKARAESAEARAGELSKLCDALASMTAHMDFALGQAAKMNGSLMGVIPPRQGMTAERIALWQPIMDTIFGAADFAEILGAERNRVDALLTPEVKRLIVAVREQIAASANGGQGVPGKDGESNAQ